MKDQSLDQALVEAVRFIRAAKQLRAARKRERALYGAGASTLPRESGALRRASMDLTRSLADLRQGR